VFIELFEGLGLCDLSVAEGFNDIEDLGPGGEGAQVISLIFVDGHNEFELLVRHLAFFGGFSVVASSSAGAASPVEAEAAVHDAVSAVLLDPSFRMNIFIHYNIAPILLLLKPDEAGQ